MKTFFMFCKRCRAGGFCFKLCGETRSPQVVWLIKDINKNKDFIPFFFASFVPFVVQILYSS